ncbi:MAG: hypothetical protein KK926_04115 [Methanomethylovorans sp.]|nr:hypothetical protein [Methanomethylovorans sp.]
MRRRFTFKCWNLDCGKIYSLFKEITDEQVLIVACPFCLKEGVVDLAPYKKKTTVVRRKGDVEEPSIGYEYEFPDVVPTEEEPKQ